MHRHRSKRARALRMIATYTLVPVVIVSLATVLVLYMLGWRFNPTERTVQQGGLMQFDSRPSGATVTVNGNRLSGTTSSRQDMTAGSHTVRMERQGYTPWQKTVTMEPGKILWLNYARLIPTTVTTDQIAAYDQLHASLAAPYDQARMLLQPKVDAPEFILLQADNGDAPRTTVTIPAEQLLEVPEGKSARFSMHSWDKDARFVLVSQQVDDATEWLVLDTRAPERSQNISRLVGGPIESVLFDVKNSQAVYVLSNHSLRRVELVGRTLSAPLIDHVATVTQSNEGVLSYTSLPSEPRDGETPSRSLGYYTPGAAKPQTVRSIPLDDAPLEMRIVEYMGQQYVIIRHGDTLEVAKTSLHPSDSETPLKLSPQASLMLPEGTGSLEISPRQRFVMAQRGATFVTYDIDLAHLSTTTQIGEADARPVRWLDNYMVWSDRDGELRSYEFDGENSHPIIKVAKGHDVTLSSGGRYVYAIQPVESGEGLALVRARLILP